jgi:hypothetical protein
MFLVDVWVTVSNAELVVEGALDIGLCWVTELLGGVVLEMGVEETTDELELELELDVVIVPLRGACELGSEDEDELELGDGVDDGLGLEEGVGLRIGEELTIGVELELDVAVVENWT